MVVGLVVSAVTVCFVLWPVLPPLVIGPVLAVRRVIRAVLARCASSVVIRIMVPYRIVGIMLLGRKSSVMIGFVLVRRVIEVVRACPVVSVMLPGRLLHVMLPRGLLLEGHHSGGRRRNAEGQDDWIHLRFL